MKHAVRSLLESSRNFILLAVLGALVAAVILTLYGVLAVASLTLGIVSDLPGGHFNKDQVESVALEFITLVDVFLLAIVLYIVALGLYELFVDPDMVLPGWLKIEDIDDLKEKLGGVVIVLLAVNFLSDYVEGPGDGAVAQDILWLGLGSAAVITAISVAFFLRPRHERREPVVESAPPLPLAADDGHSGPGTVLRSSGPGPGSLQAGDPSSQ